MAYLTARSPSLLGAYRRVSPATVLPQQRVTWVQAPRFPRRPMPRPRFGLGQDLPADASGALPLDVSAPASVMPFAPTNYPPLPAQINANYTTEPMNLDPLNFVSPQAAIAAGVDPTKTAAAWTKAIASFPTQQAALSAGIPAGVITQLWATSRSAVTPPGGSWFAGSTFGIKNAYLVAGLAGIVLLAGGKRGRR